MVDTVDLGAPQNAPTDHTLTFDFLGGPAPYEVVALSNDPSEFKRARALQKAFESEVAPSTGVYDLFLAEAWAKRLELLQASLVASANQARLEAIRVHSDVCLAGYYSRRSELRQEAAAAYKQLQTEADIARNRIETHESELWGLDLAEVAQRDLITSLWERDLRVMAQTSKRWLRKELRYNTLGVQDHPFGISQLWDESGLKWGRQHQRIFADEMELFEWESVQAPENRFVIGFVHGSNPPHCDEQETSIWNYRWFDPTGRNMRPYVDEIGRSVQSSLPPYAVPCGKFGWWRRVITRKVIGTVWWETGEEKVTPRKGDFVYSLVAAECSHRPGYYTNGDWNLAKVFTAVAGYRTVVLGPLLEWEHEGQTFQARQVQGDSRQALIGEGEVGTWLSELVFLPFGRNYQHLRPRMTVVSNSLKAVVSKIESKDVATTIRMQYDAVIAHIRSTDEDLVAPLRLARGAALKAGVLPVDPVEELRRLQDAKRAALVEAGIQVPYAPV